MDYKDYTPVSGDNILGHLVFGMGASNVVSTIINGKIIMENRKLKNIDEDKIMTKHVVYLKSCGKEFKE